MKKVISALTAATMVASMSASVISAFAAYSAGDVGFYLKVVSEGNYTVSDDGKTITFATAADAAGAKFTVAHYINADVANAEVSMVGGQLEVSDNNVILPTAGVDYNDESYSSSAQTYTAGDGTSFETTLFVNTFGALRGRSKKYASATGSFEYGSSNDWTDAKWQAVYSGNQRFFWTWTYDLDGGASQSTGFLGEKSDSFPVTQFDVSLSDSITDGTYTLDWKESFIHPDYLDTPSQGVMVQTFFANEDGKKVTPATLDGLTIVVGDPNVQPDTTEPDTTEAQPDTTEAQPDTTEAQPDTTEPPVEEKTHDKGFEFYIEDVVLDPNETDNFELLLKVYNDTTGIAGYTFNLLIDGMTPSDPNFPFDIDLIEPGKAYTETQNKMANIAEFSFAWSSSNQDGNCASAADGSDVVIYTIYTKDGVTYEPGTKYQVTFADGTRVSDYQQNLFDVALTPGTITIAGGEEQPDTTEEQPDTTEEQPDTTEEQPDTTEEQPDTTEEQPDTTTPQPGNYIYGDVNKNGTVELVDIVLLNRYLTQYEGQTLDDYQVVVANCYRNGESDADTTAANLDGKDSVEILKYLIGLVATLPTQG